MLVWYPMGVEKAAELGYEYVEPMVHWGRELLSEAGYFHSVSILGDGLRAKLFSDRFRSNLQGYQAVDVFRAHAAHAPEHPLSRVQYLDLKTYLVGDILTKVDRASMAHGLEVRVPILDHKLVEWMAGLSPDFKLRGREGKSARIREKLG